MRRVALIVAGVIAAWLVLLVALGAIVAGRTGRHVADRVAASVQGTATLGSSSLSLVWGGLELGDLHVTRDDEVGHLSLDVGAVTCDLGPLGIAIFDRTCGDLEVRRVRLEVSTFALFKPRKPSRPPFRASRVVLDDATIRFAPGAFVPGVGAIVVEVAHAEAGPTTLKTPLSWLFSLREMAARIRLPAGIAFELAVHDGVLSARGTLFGATPVAVPLRIPAVDAGGDARAELSELVVLGRHAAEALVEKRAEDWLRATLR